MKKNLNRQCLWNLSVDLFIFNVENTFNQGDFETFIADVKERQDKYEQKYNIGFKLIQELLKLLKCQILYWVQDI